MNYNQIADYSVRVFESGVYQIRFSANNYHDCVAFAQTLNTELVICKNGSIIFLTKF